MLEKLLDPIFAPFRLLRSTIWGIQQAPAQLKGEIGRAKHEEENSPIFFFGLAAFALFLAPAAISL